MASALDYAALRPYFEALAVDDERTRLDASCAILAGLERASADTCRSVLERLIKGLASGRKSARIGFSVTLTELLARLFGPEDPNPYDAGISLSQVLELLKARTKPDGSASGQEERDHHLGRLFGLEAVLKASVIFRREAWRAEWEVILNMVFDLARRKPWLSEQCGWAVYETLQASPSAPSGMLFAETVIDRMCHAKMASSPEGVAIWLGVRSLYPDVTLPKQPWHRRDPLHVENVALLAKIMREAAGSGPEAHRDEARGRGMWNPRPNFSWGVIFRHLYSDPPDKRRLSFKAFWVSVVDEYLFSASASQERKHWGFKLFSDVVQAAPQCFLQDVFGKNAIRCLINQLSDGERYLHRAALKALKAVQARVNEQPETAYDMVTGLMFHNGVPNFDHLTKTKTVQTLLTNATPTTLDLIVPRIEMTVHDPGTSDPRIAEGHRRALADLLQTLIKSRTAGCSDSWVHVTLTLFARFGYLKAKETFGEPIPPLSDASRALFRTRLSSCFAHLLSDKETARADWQHRMLRYLRSETRSGRWEYLVDLDGPVQKVAKAAWRRFKALDEMEKSASEREKLHLRAFKMLYSSVMFQLYGGERDASSILSDLNALCDSAIRKKKEDGGSTSVILIDILLGLLSKSSLLLRKLAQQVFSAFTSEITAEGLQLLLTVLQSKESVAGQHELFEQESGSDDGDGVAEIAEANGHSEEPAGKAGSFDNADIEMAEADDGHPSRAIKGERSEHDNSHHASDDASDNSDADSQESDSDAPESDADADDDETAKLNAALAGIVKTKPFSEDVAQGEGSSDDDEEMNDDQMFALDDRMSRVFKERKKIPDEKRERREARQNVVNLKNRALDLLEVYIKQEHANPLCLDLLLPLLVLMRTTRSKQLSVRTGNLIRELARRAKSKDLPATASIEDAWDALRRVHDEITATEASRAHAAACSQASLLLVKVLVAADRANVEGVVRLYGATQTKWLMGRARVQPALFSDFINWSTSFAKVPPS